MSSKQRIHSPSADVSLGDQVESPLLRSRAGIAHISDNARLADEARIEAEVSRQQLYVPVKGPHPFLEEEPEQRE